MRRIWPVLVGVVAVIVVVAMVGLTLRGSTNGPAPTYSSASRAANVVADGVPGGPWNLVVVVGVDLATATTVSVNGTVGSGCAYAAPNGGPPATSIYVPRYGGSYSSGGSPWWGLIYFQPTSHDVLLVAVVNGSARAVLIASGSCTGAFENYTTIPTNVVDSSTVASRVWVAGGSAFLSSHSNEGYNMIAGLLGGGAPCSFTTGSCWLVQYTPCNPMSQSNPSGDQIVLSALANADTGSVVVIGQSTSTCASSGFSLGPRASVGLSVTPPWPGP